MNISGATKGERFIFFHLIDPFVGQFLLLRLKLERIPLLSTLLDHSLSK